MQFIYAVYIYSIWSYTQSWCGYEWCLSFGHLRLRLCLSDHSLFKCTFLTELLNSLNLKPWSFGRTWSKLDLMLNCFTAITRGSHADHMLSHPLSHVSLSPVLNHRTQAAKTEKLKFAFMMFDEAGTTKFQTAWEPCFRQLLINSFIV